MQFWMLVEPWDYFFSFEGLIIYCRIQGDNGKRDMLLLQLRLWSSNLPFVGYPDFTFLLPIFPPFSSLVFFTTDILVFFFSRSHDQFVFLKDK